MRALFIEHDPGATPGLVGAELARRGFAIDRLRISDSLTEATWHGAFPDLDGVDLLVPLGAIWSLYDRDTVGSWIDRELDLLREADATEVPVLGICFGGQALAAAHGGKVGPAERPEIGWTEIDSDEPDLVPPGPWMQWHTDRFEVPDGAVEVARNGAGPQAFRLRRSLGVQFHPEVDAERVASWIEMGGQEAVDAAERAGTTVEALLAECRAQQGRAEADVARLLDRFLADVAGLA